MLNGRKIIDISPLISSEIAVFPGDTPFKEEFLMDFQTGDHLTLSKIESTVHLGAHTDAPNHYHKNGMGIEKRELNRYLGRAQVITVEKPRGTRIRVEDVKNTKVLCERVLFRTRSFPNPNQWNGDFNSLSSELISWLSERGVILVGIDTPSIDPADDKVLESHSEVFKCDMSILEGIVLEEATDGVYDLIALPLKIKGADASPVRAILLQ